jgi:hypothetical protein
VRKIDAFAHILPPSYVRRLESIMSGGQVSGRILGYQPWIGEDPALIDLDARWRVMDAFGDYVQVLTLAVPPPAELGEPGVARLASPLEDPDRAAIMAGLNGDPMDYFRRFYADTAMFGTTHAVRCAVEFFGTSHVLSGTDMPLGGPTVVADTIADIEALCLPHADAAAIFAENAGRVLRIPA